MRFRNFDLAQDEFHVGQIEGEGAHFSYSR
jgi:hypothetical protein